MNLFQYNENIVESLQIREEKKQQCRKVHVVKEELRENMKPFYDKETFNYNSMFTFVGRHEASSLRSETIPIRNESQRVRSTREYEQAELLSSGQQEPPKEENSQDSKNSQINLIRECSAALERLQQESQEISSNPNVSSIDKTYNFAKYENNNEIEEEKFEIAEQSGSGFSGLNDISQLESKIEFEHDSDYEDEKELLLQFSIISNQAQVIDDEANEHEGEKNSQNDKENEQRNNLNSEERNKKIEELKELPFERIIYKVRSTNCKKISIQYMDDGLGYKGVPKKLANPSFLNIKSSRIALKVNGETEWEVGSSKTKITPLYFKVTCICATKTKIMLENEKSYFCDNSKCCNLIEISIERVKDTQ